MSSRNCLRDCFSISIFLALLLVCQADDIISGDKPIKPAPNQLDASSVSKETIDILVKFFSSTGIDFDPNDKQLAVRYSDKAIEAMSDALHHVDDPEKFSEVNCLVNNIIHDDELHNAPREEMSAPVEPAHEALLRALELMVPGPGPEDMFTKAKSSLRDLYKSHPAHAKELLARFDKALSNGEMDTEMIVIRLSHYYDNWVPLPHFADYIRDLHQ